MSRRGRRKLASFALGLVAAWLSGGVGRAQEAAIQCPTTVPVGEELRNPPEIRAQGGVLNTKFQVQVKQECVPVATTTNNTTTWAYQPLSLRTYVYPDPQTGKPRWGFPGPTLHIRKSEEVPTPGKPTVKLGDRLKVLLVNDLEPDKPGPGGCNNACPASTVCPAESQLPTDCASNPNQATCCCWVNVNQKWPDCFHGDNTTNLHFHGTHVSPQAPQDYVLLELRPRPKPGAQEDHSHPAHERGVVAYGEYQYNVDPPPPTQAEGTHWYHPHKHGSVSLQVANGMPGALIIEGAFDDWLRNYYHGHMADKLLVIQQVQQSTNLFNPNAPAPTPLINGQVSPKVTMKPGEVQRWRFVNATMQVASQISINFPAGVTVKQIAMDGVRFAPENYDRQPLFDPAQPRLFKISPGNRADFLVQAPVTPGVFHVRHRVIGNLSANTQRRLQLREGALRALTRDQSNDAQTSGPDLFTLVVEAPKPQPKGKKAAAPAVATGFPTVAQWPKMPWYLRDLPDKVAGQQNLTFAMTSEPSGQPAGPGDPTAIFTINGIQYNDKCVNVTTALNSVEEWTVKNTSALKHPFHIHTNPFQVINDGTTAFKPPYVWQDTIALPAGTTQAPGSVELRHRYLEFTGEYVLHCHFLGHEDRGMMFGVQTVCKDDPTHYGKSKPYPQPECVPGNLIPAATQCSTTTSPAATGSASGGEHEH
jgi:FtsP/CotA-like multicopper oxidase with cupredoxin domain